MKISPIAARKKARIEIIPLIDIIFFLLATFVMVSLSMVKSQGISVNLPKAAKGIVTSSAKNKAIVVTITQNNEIYYNKTKVKFAELAALFAELKRKDPDPIVMLNGDEQALLGRAVSIFNEAKKAGIARFGIGAAPE